MKEYVPNWDRAIHISTKIDDDLISSLTPTILKLKQQNSDPITVGIDSPGGSIASLEALLGLLRSPCPNGKRCRIITVVTNKAYSAAANLLALGDYSIAFPHSKILYHDVRYGGIDDVTPDKARKAAKDLKEANDEFALKISRHIVQRFIWVYLSLFNQIKESRTQYSYTAKKFDEILQVFTVSEPSNAIDVAGYATTLFRRLSLQAYEIIRLAIEKLSPWAQMERIENLCADKKMSIDLLSGVCDLYRVLQSEGTAQVSDGTPELDEGTKDDLKLFLKLTVWKIVETPSRPGNLIDSLEMIQHEFSEIKRISDKKHIDTVMGLMTNWGSIFFGADASAKLASANEEEREKITATLLPQVKLFWYLIVLISRCLFEGDHFLTPSDAQLLGIVDEIVGVKYIESLGEYKIRQATEGDVQQLQPVQPV